MWELDHKESRAPKNWCFWTVVLEKTLQNPLDSKEIKPVNPKGNQPWIFTGRTDAEAEAPVFWSSDVNRWLWKSPCSWERLRAEGEESIRGWDGWMASLMQWTWTWANTRRWWETGRPGMLQSMESQRVGHDWVTEQRQQQCAFYACFLESFYHKWVLNFVKGFPCIYWDNILILSFSLLIWCITLIDLSTLNNPSSLG